MDYGKIKEAAQNYQEDKELLVFLQIPTVQRSP